MKVDHTSKEIKIKLVCRNIRHEWKGVYTDCVDSVVFKSCKERIKKPYITLTFLSYPYFLLYFVILSLQDSCV